MRLRPLKRAEPASRPRTLGIACCPATPTRSVQAQRCTFPMLVCARSRAARHRNSRWCRMCGRWLSRRAIRLRPHQRGAGPLGHELAGAGVLLALRGLHDDRVGLGVGVLPDARDLPRDLEAGGAAGDAEAVVLDLCRDVDRGVRPDGGQLIPEVTVQCARSSRAGSRWPRPSPSSVTMPL